MLTSTTPRPNRRPARRPVRRLSRRFSRRASIVGLALAPVLAASACSAADPAPTVASLPSSASSAASSSAPAASSAASDPASAAPDPSGASPTDPAAAGGGAAGTPSAAGRPQFRLDDTDERRTALVNAYSQCLLDHGATKGEGRAAAAGAAGADGGSGGTPLLVVADPVPAAASAACADRLPLLPPEVEAATNPDFRAQAQAYVACMRDHGLWVQLLNNHDLDWTYVDDHPVPTTSVQIEHDCLLEAFS